MIVNHANYMILSANANTPFWEHWEAQPYPQWAALTGIAHVPVAPGFSVEPHYHDCDEFWLLIEGDGEAWMDDRAYLYTSNTAVYNPMGVIHRAQSFTAGLSSGLFTRLERQKRPGHLRTWEVGPPGPTVPGFVVPGGAIRVRSLIADRAARLVSYALCRCAQVKARQMEWRRATSIGTSLRGRCTYRSTGWRWT